MSRQKHFSSPAFAAVVTVLLAVGGIEVWLTLGRGEWVRNHQVEVMGLSILAMLVPSVRRAVVRALDAVRHPSPRTAALIAVAVAGLASAYLYITAVGQHFGFYPKIHDEFVYLTQASLLARGRLWMKAPALPEFFDTFYILVKPIYAPIYWPGTALLLVPAHWLRLPIWLTPLLAAGAVVGLLYRVVTDLFDGVAGLLAALLLADVSIFRWLALTPMSQVPMLLFGLALTWAWLRWRDGARPRWAWAIGAIGGWAAITRPIDAICFALPIGIAMIFSKKPRVQAPWASQRIRGFVVRGVPVSIALLAGAGPFLALQLIFNLGVTGSLLHSPYMFYNQRDQPTLAYGFPRFDPARRPASQLPEKQLLYDQWIGPAAREHTLANAPRQFLKNGQEAFDMATGHPLLIALLPLGLTAMFRRRRWVVWAVLPLFLLLYVPHTVFLPHYALLIAPAIILMVVGSVEVLARRFPNRPGLPATATVAVAALAIASLPQFDHWVRDDTLQMPMMKRVSELPGQVSGPALVMFRYEPGASPQEEPVYNADVAWPDDAPIIHAHDLGPERDRDLYRYYARQNPARRVYRFDRGDGSVTYLGTVAQLGN